MKKQKYYLYLSSEETSVVLHCLISLKNTLIQQGRCADCVDELIMKILEAPVRKVSV